MSDTNPSDSYGDGKGPNPRHGRRVPNPPRVSQEAIDSCVREIREVADHYGWTDAELESDMREVARFIRREVGVKERHQGTDE